MNTQDLKIDPEFEKLLPPLSEEEFQALEADIVNSGKVLNAIFVWNGVIVDGHNRYEICQNHGIEFDVQEMQFDSREDAKLWMIRHQLARRNLPDYVRCELVLRIKPSLSKAAKKNMAKGLQNSAKVDVREELACIAGVSHDTISRVETITKEAPEEIKAQLRKEEVTINAAYKKCKNPAKSTSDVAPAKIEYHKIIARVEKLVEDLFDNQDELSDEDKIDIERICESLNAIVYPDDDTSETASEALESTIAS